MTNFFENVIAIFQCWLFHFQLYKISHGILVITKKSKSHPLMTFKTSFLSLGLQLVDSSRENSSSRVVSQINFWGQPTFVYLVLMDEWGLLSHYGTNWQKVKQLELFNPNCHTHFMWSLYHHFASFEKLQKTIITHRPFTELTPDTKTNWPDTLASLMATCSSFSCCTFSNRQDPITVESDKGKWELIWRVFVQMEFGYESDLLSGTDKNP